MKLFISPHNDDETLFGAFTILRERPVVVIVFDGHVQRQRGLNVTAEQRRQESINALDILGVPKEHVLFTGISDACEIESPYIGHCISQTIMKYSSADSVEEIFFPAIEAKGHHQHNLVGDAVIYSQIPGIKVTSYLTYTTGGKSVSKQKVQITQSDWIARKLRALACYESQMNTDPRMGCWPHFLRDQNEYYA